MRRRARAAFRRYVYERERKGIPEAPGALSPWDGLLSLPEGCELAVREKDGKQFVFVLNYQKEAQTITLNQEMTDLDDGSRVQGEVTLAAYETKVYRL